MISPSQLAANRENAQASTGPNTPEGKARSSQNAFKNGLASGRLIIPGEDPAEFNALLSALMDEHQPASPTESILVEALAKHHWLESRAQRLQTQALEAFLPELPPDFALLLRYETTHHRAFHKSLATLLKLQKDRREAPNGFVSQNPSNSPEPPTLPPPDSCLLTPDSCLFDWDNITIPADLDYPSAALIQEATGELRENIAAQPENRRALAEKYFNFLKMLSLDHVVNFTVDDVAPLVDATKDAA